MSALLENQSTTTLPALMAPLATAPAALTAVEPTVAATLTAVLATDTAAPATVTTVQPATDSEMAAVTQQRPTL